MNPTDKTHVTEPRAGYATTPSAVAGTDRVLIFDTTLRDGEQSPGASMNLAEKLEVARTLEALGVDIIEAGFPIASPDDFAAVKAVAEQSTRARICGLARALKGDIDRAAEAVKPAGCSTSRTGVPWDGRIRRNLRFLHDEGLPC